MNKANHASAQLNLAKTKIKNEEVPGIKPETSLLAVRNADHSGNEAVNKVNKINNNNNNNNRKLPWSTGQRL